MQMVRIKLGFGRLPHLPTYVKGPSPMLGKRKRALQLEPQQCMMLLSMESEISQKLV